MAGDDDPSKGFNERDAGIDGLREDVSTLKVDTAVMKRMMGTVLAMRVTILLRIFTP